MSARFPIVLSPYDLDARGLVADVALLTADPVLTLLPAPFEGLDAESVRAAAASAPEFQRLVARWSWMQDLWRSAVIRPEFVGLSPVDFVRETAAEVLGDSAPAALAGVLRPGVFDSTHAYLRALCRDLPLGGGQPSVSVPVSVGMSRYAHAIDAPLIQGQARRAGSVVQKLETRATRTLTGLSLLIPRDLEPETVLRFRAACPLADLHETLDAPDPSADELNRAERAWNRSVMALAQDLRIPSAARRGRRLSTIRLSIGTMPLEATLAAAVRASSLAAPRRAARSRPAPAQSTAALANRPLRVLSVRELPWQPPAE